MTTIKDNLSEAVCLMCGHVDYEPTWRSGNCTSLLENPEKMQGRAPIVWFCVDCAWWKQ